MAEFNDIKYLADIKSSYIIKGIFLFLNVKQRLNLIIYNKKLQNIFGVDSITYKRISTKYIIGEKNGKGKEYSSDKDKLIFEGEYLNGKRNGKGKEYNENGRKKFRGEYIKGERNGKGKEYNKNGNLVFKGEYLNGKRNGEGKLYYSDGKLRYEGKFLNNKIWNGKIYNKDGEIECEIKDGKG